MGREEKLERVGKKKESWQVSRMSLAVVVEMVKRVWISFCIDIIFVRAEYSNVLQTLGDLYH